MSLYSKTTINTPLMHKVRDGDMVKSEMLPHLPVAIWCHVSADDPGGSYSIRSLQVESLAANGR